MSEAGWSKADIERLKQLWCVDKKTAKEIADLMPGRSRSAVLGKINRLKLPLKYNGQTQPKVPRPKSTETRWKPIKAPAKKILVVPDRLFALMEIQPRMCLFPFGDHGTKAFGFCGACVTGTGRYCDAHAAIAYQRKTKKRKAQDEHADA